MTSPGCTSQRDLRISPCPSSARLTVTSPSLLDRVALTFSCLEGSIQEIVALACGIFDFITQHCSSIDSPLW
jgi:hypothetical protein